MRDGVTKYVIFFQTFAHGGVFVKNQVKTFGDGEVSPAVLQMPPGVILHCIRPDIFSDDVVNRFRDKAFKLTEIASGTALPTGWDRTGFTDA